MRSYHAQVCLGEIPLRLKMRKAHSADVMELETHQRDASAANRALELLGREVDLFTEKRWLWQRAQLLTVCSFRFARPTKRRR